jgi:medium-chain acyl-[acyl-carrier-protein] hydrolase
MKLFCLPYAGGAASIFSKWPQYLKKDITVFAVELTGRGRRVDEQYYETLDDAVDDVFNQISHLITDADYALFGHSMGSLLSFKLAYKIKAEELPPPKHLFFSGRGAPHIPRADKRKFHLMNDVDFIKEIGILGGTTPEFFDHPELLALFLPLLRNDFKILETDFTDYNQLSGPLGSDITVLFGEDEAITEVQKAGWKIYSDRACNILHFPGNHFFINTSTDEITAMINGTL